METIGDAYMVVGGLPERRKDHAECIAQFALDMLNEAAHVCLLISFTTSFERSALQSTMSLSRFASESIRLAFSSSFFDV